MGSTMKFCKSAILTALMVLSTYNAYAQPAKTASAKTLFAMILNLENSIPLQKAVVEKLTGRQLKLKMNFKDTREYDSGVSKSNLVRHVWLKEAAPPDQFFKGIAIVYLNKTKPVTSESAIQAAFGSPDRTDSALNADIDEASQTKSLIYKTKWGLLIFDVDKTPEHCLEKVCLQASLSPPL
jgi:hypothetical protein